MSKIFHKVIQNTNEIYIIEIVFKVFLFLLKYSCFILFSISYIYILVSFIFIVVVSDREIKDF